MSDHQEPNLDGDGYGANSCYSSSFQRTVVLRDWWLIKCSNEFEGKQFGVAGTETSFESRAMRVFTSSPIIKALDVFTLQASNGICITLRGFLNKERVVKNGFKPEICREFIFGFPPCWERICNDCFQGDSDINTIDKACSPILSSCKYSRGSLEDNPSESRDKSTVTEANIAEINSKDGSRARDKKTARRKSLRLQTKSGGKSAEGERKLESSKVQNTTNDGDHGSEGLNKAKSSDVEKDECEAINNEDNYDSKVQNCTSDEDRGSEDLDKAKSIDVEKDECEAINDEVISPTDGCGRKQTGADIVDKVTSVSATGESLTSEQGRGEVKVTTASPHSLLKDLDKSSKPEKKRRSKKSKKTLEIDGNVVEPMNHSRTKVKSVEKKRKLDVSKIQNPTTNDGDHGSKGLNKAKSGAGDVAEDECEAINSEGNERKLGDSKVQNRTSDEDHGSEGLDKAESNDVQKDECVAVDNEVISPADGCGRKHTGADNVDKGTSMSVTGESLTSEQRKGELKVTTASPQCLFKDMDKSCKPGKKRKSKKSEKTLKSDGNAVEPMNTSGTKVRSAEENRKLDASKIQNPTTNDGDHGSECLNKVESNDAGKYECLAINNEVISAVDGCGKKHSGTDGVEKLTSKNASRESLTSEQRKGKRKGTKTSLHSLSKDINNSSKPGKNRKSKKSEKTLKCDSNVVEPMNHSGSEVKEAEKDLSWGETKRKIDFDVEVTPEKESKKQKTNGVSTDSLGQKRSRSGRLLVSSLEFWRNQIPVYDMDRNLIQVREGSETKSAPSKVKGSKSRKPRS
ncbi:putative kinetochore-associated protein KNL-2 [Cardamine amara subsp. amara]|uniref:Kinetochore-associated protein KNL-2 n=1 Tax=Cardamine amara subsp. amara TaxID=228776 RepID=A0ABD0ZZR8_CARAN